MKTATLDYKQLIIDLPPKVIRSEKENHFYLDKLSAMMRRWDQLSPAERDLFETISVLVHEFERKTYKLPAADPVETVKTLIEANGLKQKDLVGIFESPSVVSEVLSGKRQLTIAHIKRLAERFNVSPAAFL